MFKKHSIDQSLWGQKQNVHTCIPWWRHQQQLQGLTPFFGLLWVHEIYFHHLLCRPRTALLVLPYTHLAMRTVLPLTDVPQAFLSPLQNSVVPQPISRTYLSCFCSYLVFLWVQLSQQHYNGEMTITSSRFSLCTLHIHALQYHKRTEAYYPSSQYLKRNRIGSVPSLVL
jgi:hypothetical protein